jgi:hypothetical protein
MAKKVNCFFDGEMRKNDVKGGAWIAEFHVTRDDQERPVAANYSAWANPSAAKKWLKEMVLKHTNKKSIKMVASAERDAKDKPVFFEGKVAFKVDA